MKEGIACAYHRHGRLDAHALLDGGLQVRELVEEVEGEDGVRVAANDAVQLLADLRKHIRVVDEVLEAVREPAAHRILRREEEGEDDERHLAVAKVLAALVRRVVQHLAPLVEQAARGLSRGHGDLRLVRGVLEPLEGDLARLDRAVDLRAGDGEGEVDELERDGDVPVLLRNLRDGWWDVMAAEDRLSMVKRVKGC